MKRICLLWVLYLLAGHVYGQGPDRLPGRNALTPGDTVLGRRVSYSVSVGSSFIKGNGAAGSSFFVAPQFFWAFSSRLNINAGLVMNRNNYSLPLAYQGTDGKSVVIRNTPVASSNLFFANGTYAVSPRLMLTGSVVSTLGSQAADNAEQNAWNNTYHLMSLGVTYWITKNITLSAAMQMVHSNNLLYSSDYNDYYDPYSSGYYLGK